MHNYKFLFLLLLIGAMLALAWGTPLTVRAQAEPTATTPSVPFETPTPLSDGSILHEVQPGQTLWNIAMDYGVSVDDLMRYNLIPTEGVVYAGQKLVIAPSFTPTASPTITETPPPPTRTLQATYTPRSPTGTPTPSATPEPTLAPTQPNLFESALSDSNNRRALGIGMIIICSLGIAVVLVSGLRKK